MQNQAKIKVGDIYTLRNGLKTSPIRLANNGTNYTFAADVQEERYNNKSVLAWLPSGKYLTEQIEHELDIITN